MYKDYNDFFINEFDAFCEVLTEYVGQVACTIELFINTCTIMNDTLSWDVAGDYNEWECIDICPDTLLDAPIVENIEEVEEKLFAHQ